MLARVLGMLCLLLAVVAIFSPARSACDQGKALTYGDIGEIRYERTGCFQKCQSYQVLLTAYNDCYYVGAAYVTKHGTYEAACSPVVFRQAIAVLVRHEFFSLHTDGALVTDVPDYIVSVERCGVTTRLDWPVHGDRNGNDIESLLNALDAITNHIRWHKVSASLETP